MHWMQLLYETYQNCQSQANVSSDKDVPLLPVCHTTQKAQIEVVLDRTGAFMRASLVPVDAARTIIPCTEKSGGRTSGEAAHPLCDKLQYLAADYEKYSAEHDSYYASYLRQLTDWVGKGAPEKVRLIWEYIRRGDVIADLVAYQILVTDTTGRLVYQRPRQKNRTDPLDIFDLLPGRYNPLKNRYESWQADAFLRWRVETPGATESAVWLDPEVIENWISFYSSLQQSKGLCYVTGEEVILAQQHPAKIRSDGDKAKLISSGKTTKSTGEVTIDDGCGFTFLGRFTYPEQALTIGYETTQKAHSALRWLIARQGYNRDDLAVVAWAKSGSPVPQPTSGADDLLFGNAPAEEAIRPYTAQELSIQLRRRIAGYGKKMIPSDQIAVIGVDSATPGRLAVVYYCDLAGSDFLARIDAWHESCTWLHHYGQAEITDPVTGKRRKQLLWFVGAPAPLDIAEAAYGRKLDGELRKATVRRILPCIIEGQSIPRDLVVSVVRRASNRVGVKNNDDKRFYGDDEYTWNKTLSIACALFRKYNAKEKYTVALDPTRTTRDYLYGRLLALADGLEEWALRDARENRETNAARLMQRFAEHPCTTWRTIELALMPYKARLGGKAWKLLRMIDEVVAMFAPDDFISDKPLSGEFLLGYHSQREALRPAQGGEDDKSEEQSQPVNTNPQ